MSTSGRSHKDSLQFNQHDLNIISTGVFGNAGYFSVKVVNMFTVAKYKELYLIEVIPCYKIGKEDGIYVKKHLQNYNNIHTVLVSADVATKLQQLIKNPRQNQHLIMSFVKVQIHRKPMKRANGETLSCFFMLSANIIVAAISNERLYFTWPPHAYLQEYENMPYKFVRQLQVQRLLFLNELNWPASQIEMPLIRQTEILTSRELLSDDTQESALRIKLETLFKPREEEHEVDEWIRVCDFFEKQLTDDDSTIIQQRNSVSTPAMSDSMVGGKSSDSSDTLKSFEIIDDDIDTRHKVSLLPWSQNQYYPKEDDPCTS